MLHQGDPGLEHYPQEKDFSTCLTGARTYPVGGRPEESETLCANAYSWRRPRQVHERIGTGNALKHGLLAKQIMFSPDGALLDEGLHELFESLRDKYGRDDVRTELLIEGVVADHWRNRQGLRYEIEYLAPGKGYFGPQSGMPNLQRYTTANRRSMLRNLELLDKVQATESDSGTGQDPDEENFPQASKGDDGIDKVAEDVPKPRPKD